LDERVGGKGQSWKDQCRFNVEVSARKVRGPDDASRRRSSADSSDNQKHETAREERERCHKLPPLIGDPKSRPYKNCPAEENNPKHDTDTRQVSDRPECGIRVRNNEVQEFLWPRVASEASMPDGDKPNQIDQCERGDRHKCTARPASQLDCNGYNHDHCDAYT
jgi:hypothetical protein